MKETRTLRCITCPIGCSLTAELEDGQVVSVSGNTCPRGKAYAISEITHPVRTLTTTVFSTDGKKVPVRTSTPLSKEKMTDAMKILKRTTVTLPVHRGDILIRDFLEPGVDILVCKDFEN